MASSEPPVELYQMRVGQAQYAAYVVRYIHSTLNHEHRMRSHDDHSLVHCRRASRRAIRWVKLVPGLTEGVMGRAEVRGGEAMFA